MLGTTLNADISKSKLSSQLPQFITHPSLIIPSSLLGVATVVNNRPWERQALIITAWTTLALTSRLTIQASAGIPHPLPGMTTSIAHLCRHLSLLLARNRLWSTLCVRSKLFWAQGKTCSHRMAFQTHSISVIPTQGTILKSRWRWHTEMP